VRRREPAIREVPEAKLKMITALAAPPPCITVETTAGDRTRPRNRRR
jgi:hypothetical protein